MTPECVLVATDLSAESARAADACLDLPGPPRLLLVHVGEPTPALEGEAERLRARGAAVEARVVARGGRSIVHALLDAAAETGAEMIAVGARGRGRALDRLLGSVSEGVLRGAGTDVLVVREWDGDRLFARPLFATDLSTASVEAAERFAPGAGRGVLFHVGPAAPDALPHLAARLGLAPSTRTGVPISAIIVAAIEEKATVIVLGRIGSLDTAAGVSLGRVAEGVALAAPIPVLVAAPRTLPTGIVRELDAAEFALAEQVWRDYHGTRGDPAVDRVFGFFVDGTLASLARCRRHPDGFEVDAVFTPVPYRGHGYARRVMTGLVEACHNEDLFMYAVAGLEPFYGGFGFGSIPEADLPASVRARYTWAAGDIEAAEVTPMRRAAGWYARGG